MICSRAALRRRLPSRKLAPDDLERSLSRLADRRSGLVAPTLLYLALQVRQNTEQMRANAAHQYLETSRDLNLGIIQNKEVASVYRRGCDDFQSLDADEKTQFFFYIGQFYQTFSTMFGLWKAGKLPDSEWHTIRKHLISTMAMPGTRHVFDSWAREGLSPPFVAYVDGLCATSEATYSLKKAIGGRAPAANESETP